MPSTSAPGDAHDPQFLREKVVPVMNQKFPKNSDIDLAPVIVATLPYSLRRRVRTQLGKRADKRLPIRSTRCPEDLERLLVEDELPLRHSAPLGKELLMRGEHFLLAELAAIVHAPHRRVHLLADARIVQSVQDFEIFRQGHPLVAAQGLQFGFDLS
jgi:hypothetical protein